MARPAHRSPAKWSQQVTEHSDALDLEQGVFKRRSAKRIAESLKHSAERSERRKSSPFRSAMSMLTFYINRAGEQLSQAQRTRLESAKRELRALYGVDTKEPRTKRKEQPGRRRSAAEREV